jgi:hypothetical protein
MTMMMMMTQMMMTMMMMMLMKHQHGHQQHPIPSSITAFRPALVAAALSTPPWPEPASLSPSAPKTLWSRDRARADARQRPPGRPATPRQAPKTRIATGYDRGRPDDERQLREPARLERLRDNRFQPLIIKSQRQSKEKKRKSVISSQSNSKITS